MKKTTLFTSAALISTGLLIAGCNDSTGKNTQDTGSQANQTSLSNNPAATTHAQNNVNSCEANSCAANPCGTDNPCAANPCAASPCGTDNPCTANPCAASPCGTSNPCSANPCAASPCGASDNNM